MAVCHDGQAADDQVADLMAVEGFDDGLNASTLHVHRQL
jgi:hypothetical protein